MSTAIVRLLRMPALKPLVIGTLVVGTTSAGCSFLSPREDPSRFFLLTSPPTETRGATPNATQASIAVGPLDLPVYLTGPLLMTRIDDNEVAISDFERWAEPLYDNFLRVLAENLSGQLDARVVVFPALLSEPVHLRVPIVVRRFERDPTGAVDLWATWSIDNAATGETLEYGDSRISEPSRGPDDDASIAALSGAVASLSQEIARRIRTLP